MLSLSVLMSRSATGAIFSSILRCILRSPSCAPTNSVAAASATNPSTGSAAYLIQRFMSQPSSCDGGRRSGGAAETGRHADSARELRPTGFIHVRLHVGEHADERLGRHLHLRMADD